MDMIKRERQLFEAFKVGGIEQTRVFINENGLSHLPDWTGGYILLVQALKKGDAADVQLILKNGAMVNKEYKERCDTPLHIAVQRNYIEIVKMLLDMGADIDAKNGCDETPLHFAVGRYATDCIMMLIKKGAEIDAKNNNGETPLRRAISYKNVEAIKLFLNLGADVNDIDIRGKSPLHHAAEAGCLKSVEHILNCGADVNCGVKEGPKKNYTPLHVALENGDQRMYTLLISKEADVNVKGEDGITCLHIAAREGHTSIAEDLLKHGASVDPLTTKNYTPLIIALRHDQPAVATLLIKNGANVNATDYNGFSALHIASKTTLMWNIVELLLAYGAKVNSKTNNGVTPLHLCAIYNNSQKTIETLLEWDADINARDSRGRTALHVASKNICLDVVSILLDYGADVLIRTQGEQHTPLDYALSIKYNSDAEFACNTDDEENNCLSRYSRILNPYKCDRIVEALKHHIAKLQLAKLRVIGENLAGIVVAHQDFHEHCKEEVTRMKSEKIYGTITLFDILAKSSLDSCMRNINVVRVLAGYQYQVTNYPIYAKMIENNIRKGMKRRKLLEPSKTILHSLFENKPQLPYLCIENILSYLDNNDLKTLIQLEHS